MKLGPESVKFIVFIALGVWVIGYSLRSTSLRGRKGIAATVALLGLSVAAGGTISLILFAQRREPTLTRETVQILTTLLAQVGAFAAGLIVALFLTGSLARCRGPEQIKSEGRDQHVKRSQ